MNLKRKQNYAKAVLLKLCLKLQYRTVLERIKNIIVNKPEKKKKKKKRIMLNILEEKERK